MTDLHSVQSMDLPGGKRTVLFDGVPFGLKISSLPGRFAGPLLGFRRTAGIGG